MKVSFYQGRPFAKIWAMSEMRTLLFLVGLD